MLIAPIIRAALNAEPNNGNAKVTFPKEQAQNKLVENLSNAMKESLPMEEPLKDKSPPPGADTDTANAMEESLKDKSPPSDTDTDPRHYHYVSVMEWYSRDKTTDVLRIRAPLAFVFPSSKETISGIPDDDRYDIAVIQGKEFEPAKDDESKLKNICKNSKAIVFLLYEKKAKTQDEERNTLNPTWFTCCQTLQDKTIVVVSGRTLRATGAPVSEGLSWELTALDFARYIKKESTPILKNHHVIVTLGNEAALYRQPRGDITLYYRLKSAEVSSPPRHGRTVGTRSIMAAILVRALAGQIKANGHQIDFGPLCNAAIPEGIRFCSLHRERGFGTIPKNDTKRATFDQKWYENLFKDPPMEDYEVEQVSVCAATSNSPPLDWSIVQKRLNENLSENQKIEEVAEQVANHIVTSGLESARKKYGFPYAEIGDFKIIDRREIESFRSLRNLMQSYVDEPARWTRPLCLGVFGAPGSGKSHGVKQVAKALRAENAPISDNGLEFNVAQFTTLKDLAKCFHISRDKALGGQTPLVFLDEFDSPFEGRTFGWLKYYLSPMQDGQFRDGETVFNLGRAILVFVGGVNHSYEQLAARMRSRDFADAKGRDFVSRLRGFVDILGPNQLNANDRLFAIRRAVVLRRILKKKMPRIVHAKGKIGIDEDVLHAFLSIDEFKHGTRSMEAILDMSRLGTHRDYVKACLPLEHQLELHVDAKKFLEKLTGRQTDA